MLNKFNINRAILQHNFKTRCINFKIKNYYSKMKTKI